MKNFGKKSIFFIIQNEFVSSKMHNIPCFDTFPKNNFYKNYLKGQAMTLFQEGGQPYNPCGFVSDKLVTHTNLIIYDFKANTQAQNWDNEFKKLIKKLTGSKS